jgi:hypothetical protein
MEQNLIAKPISNLNQVTFNLGRKTGIIGMGIDLI